MTTKQMKFELDQWLDHAFRGQVPDHLAQLAHRRQTDTTVFRELVTQVPEDHRDVLEHVFELQRADTEMVLTVMEELFRRHLEHHP